MSYPSPMGLEPSLVNVNQHPLKQAQDWIPPPASLATVNPEGIDLNDEIFFNHNSAYTTFDPYAGGPEAGALLLTLLLATMPFTLLQSAITTPDILLASPLKYGHTSFNLHYSHRRRFSLAVEQLNRMSLRTSKLPLPDMYQDLLDRHMEERTINPRQLLGNAGSASHNSPDAANTASRYILPLLVLSPSLTTFFSHADMPEIGELPGLDAAINPEQLTVGYIPTDGVVSNLASALLSANSAYVMNDECVNAITYWLNNTDGVIQDASQATSQSTAGVGKPAWKRRNSIPVPTRTEVSPSRALSKRKRRKSVNTMIPEDEVPADILLPFALPKEHQMSPVTTNVYNSVTSGQVPAVYEGAAATSSLGQLTFRDNYESEAKNAESVGLPRHGSFENDDEPKPFPCPECEKQFKRLEHLKRHIRSVHSNIRPFHCKYCDKKFLRSDNLAQHSKTHFKVNANGTTTIIYGNPNPQNRGGRKKSISSDTAGVL